MSIEEITAYLEGLPEVVVLQPAEDDGSPEISWGDLFFYHSPDGTVPTAEQPFATIVTKDYPGFDESSRLDRPGTFRVNLAAGRDAVAAASAEDPSASDTVIAHPVYGSAGWVAVVDPGPRTHEVLRDLMRRAHEASRARHARRG